MDARLLEILVCPLCKGPLVFRKTEQELVCKGDRLAFAIRDGIPYAIDFCNPAPDADINSVGEENFEWVVETAAKMTIEKALAHKEGGNNLTWGQYVQDSVAGRMSFISPEAKPAKAPGKAKKQ